MDAGRPTQREFPAGRVVAPVLSLVGVAPAAALAAISA